MATTKNTKNTTFLKEFITIFEELDFNIFSKYLTTYTNETIQKILVQLNQIIAKDPNRKKDVGAIKTEILNLVGENKNIWNQTNLSTSRQKETKLSIHEILNHLKELMQTKKQEQEEDQKNNSNQKIQP